MLEVVISNARGYPDGFKTLARYPTTGSNVPALGERMAAAVGEVRGTRIS